MDFAQELLNQIPNGAFVLVGIAGAVSLLLQHFKKWLNLQSEKVVTFVLITLSFIGSGIDYLLTAASSNPQILGSHTVMIVGAATIMYRYLIKPVSTLTTEASNKRKLAETAVPQPVVPQVVDPSQPQAVSAPAPREFNL